MAFGLVGRRGDEPSTRQGWRPAQNGVTWLGTRAFVSRLDGLPTRYLLDGWLADDRTLWVHDRSVWVTTPTQARRRGRH